MIDKLKKIFKKNNKVFFIAEAGVNHNGSTKYAKKLIDIAANCGADAVKFQSFITEELLIKKAKSMSHQKRSDRKISQFKMLKKLELNKNQHIILKDYCRKKKIIFFSTAFDNKSLIFLNKLKIPLFKVPSSEINNIPYLKILGSFNKPIILSTGMSYQSEVKKALEVLNKNGTSRDKIVLMHCTSQYPSKFKDLNLNALKTLKKFNTVLGYSDHSPGLVAPIASVAIGCKVIEKHFTISKKLKGPDHLSSLNPKELKDVISSIRNLELSLGNYEKKPTVSEFQNRKLARKSVVATNFILKGSKFSEKNISLKRPGTGLSPLNYFKLIGKKSTTNYKKDDLIKYKEVN